MERGEGGTYLLTPVVGSPGSALQLTLQWEPSQFKVLNEPPDKNIREKNKYKVLNYNVFMMVMGVLVFVLRTYKRRALREGRTPIVGVNHLQESKNEKGRSRREEELVVIPFTTEQSQHGPSTSFFFIILNTFN